jgi:8-oxo-dGTP pyrophosphatase MutT (NUDIX family)
MSSRTSYSVARLTQKIKENLCSTKFISQPSELFPYGRITVAEAKTQGLVKHEAAVSILISPVEERLCILFIKRSAFGVHGGQIAFPGGRKDMGENFEITAIRELREETGVSINESQLICPLEPVFIVPSQFVVQPYVAIIEQPPVITPNREEVDSAFWIDIEDILNAKPSPQIVVVNGGSKEIAVKAFALNNEIIWGATAIILDDFRNRMAGVLHST